jgi:two-component sensor histidine kinase
VLSHELPEILGLMPQDVVHTLGDSLDDQKFAPKMLVCLRPNVQVISSARRFAGDLLGTVLKDPDATSRVALAVHELLENTLKYSTDGLAELALLVVEEQDGKRSVEVRAKNRTTPEQAAELGRRIDQLGQATDLMGLYVTMMRESARREGSGLGLARIRVEGEMQLRLERDGDAVTVSATTPTE